MKTKIGYSINKDAFASSIETATDANIKEAKLGIVFTSVNQEQDRIIKGIKSLADTPIIGCTSSAAISTNAGYMNDETGYPGMMTCFGDNASPLQGLFAQEINAFCKNYGVTDCWQMDNAEY